ncbi:dynein light chain-related protein [Rutstroemia sp. NJR-2017a WRK4]|nr:dynein light chain-related protein [Rutstroemia sp. NJR-2017a WRK4]
MAQMIDQLTGSGAAETLARLSKKPGVQATMVLDAFTGTIIQNSGTFASFRAPAAVGRSSNAGATGAGTTEETSIATSTDSQGVEELASMVWKFMSAAGGLVHGMDAEDDVKLLRLRTKKHELLIVPDLKFINVVVHETPPA